jgi:NAD(P)-dependent dehydrogenase (short-subunit alcohol dehydrogenase family)
LSDSLFDVSGRVAIVTGGMGQLGSVYASGLLERGMKVALFDIEAGEPREGVRAYEVDITDREAIKEATRAVEREWGVPHVS